MKFFYNLTSTKGLDIHSDIFKEYPDPTYIMKLRRINRPMIMIHHEEGLLAGIAVMKQTGRHLKICLLLVHRRFKNMKLGYNLLRVIRNMFEDDFNDVDILYTTAPHQFNTDRYQELLLKFGFQISTVKANGDLVYTYAKSVQKSN